MPNRAWAAAPLLAVLFATTGALGQELAAPAAAPTGGPNAAGPARALAGQQLILEIAEPISSKTHKRGDFFALRLAAPITVGETVIVPAGATGKGQVIDAAPAGPLGRPAKLLLAARYLEIDGAQVSLRGFHLGAAGKDNTNAVEGLSFVPYVGIFAGFMKGGEIVIPAGALGAAKLGADLPGKPAGAAPAATPLPASK